MKTKGIKYLRLWITRQVKQNAYEEIKLSNDEYEQINNGQLDVEAFIANKFEDDFGYNNIGWKETSAEDIKISNYKLGNWNDHEN